MASEYSITIQVARTYLHPFVAGHVAIGVNTPSGTIYAGFGPNHSEQYLGASYAQGQFDIQFVEPGASPAVGDWSTVFDEPSYITFRLPASQEQAAAIVGQMAQIAASPGNYNIYDQNVCSYVAGQLTDAGGLGNITNIFSVWPGVIGEHLTAIANALANDPNATHYSIGGGVNDPPLVLRIPDQLRGLQQVVPENEGLPASGSGSGLGGQNIFLCFTSASGGAGGLSYSQMWANTTPADIAEFGGDVQAAVLANLTDAAAAAARYRANEIQQSWPQWVQGQTNSAAAATADAPWPLSQVVPTAWPTDGGEASSPFFLPSDLSESSFPNGVPNVWGVSAPPSFDASNSQAYSPSVLPFGGQDAFSAAVQLTPDLASGGPIFSSDSANDPLAGC